MQKNVSLQLKGVAILMMLFLHLFNRRELVELCDTTLYFWNGKPLVSALSRVAAFCVPIYLFVSGYGLSHVYDRGAGRMHAGRRLWKLYVNYWVVLVLFVTLGAFIAPDRYPGDALTFVLNASGWWHNYNYEWWFLFPYVVLVLAAPVIFSLLRRCDGRRCAWVVAGLTVLDVAVYCSDMAWGKFFDAHYVMQQLRQEVYCLYSFVLGAVFHQYRLVERFRFWLNGRVRPARRVPLLSLCLLVMVLLRMSLGPSVINPFFVLLFILIFNMLPMHRALGTFLEYMGGHSTNMWLSHSFFCYYLFQDFIYGLRYPSVIYAVLIVLSLAASYVIRFITNRLVAR